ncbi:MAG: sulfotransferase [Limnoraphis robusta]|jgi:hypothetical protein
MKTLPCIVNVGLPRTGTTSFARATEMLGFKSLHIWKPGEHNPEILKQFRANVRDVRRIVEQYHTLSDTPFYALRETFEHYYPDTLILYTTRPKPDWIESMVKYQVAGGQFLANLYRMPRFPYTVADKDLLSHLYDTHHAAVCQGLPSINIGENDDRPKWELLCSALPNPREMMERARHLKWPHANQFQQTNAQNDTGKASVQSQCS